jgi:hypothetical protein
MRIPWLLLPEVEQRAFRTAHGFLSGRLEERDVFEWALRLGAHRQAERIAVSEVFENSDQDIKEPWNSAWALLLEYWGQTANPATADTDIFRVRSRIDRGDASGQLIERIVDLVRPVVEIKPRSTYPGIDNETPREKPRAVSDIASVNIASGRLVDIDRLGLESIQDEAFLIELVSKLDSAIRAAFSLAKRMGFEEVDWRLELPNRIYTVATLDGGEEDPDEYQRGIAPIVKLLYAVVERLGRVNISSAKATVASWRASSLSIHNRMWNTIARDPIYASPSEVESIITTASDIDFWGMGKHPEISELRAVRFSTLTPDVQLAVERRVRKGPSRSFWRKGDKDRIKSIQLHWTARELRRIQIGGGTLSTANDAWLANQLAMSDELREMTTIDHDFRRGFRARRINPNPDKRFDDMAGLERLDALESALATTERTWDDDPQSRAWDWIRDGENSRLVLQDLEIAPQYGASYPEVWDRLGSALNPPSEDGADEATLARGIRDAERVLEMLMVLPLATAANAISGISGWMDRWHSVAKGVDLLIPVWQRLWPIAVDVTNAHKEDLTGVDPTADQNVEDQNNERLDTLNNPVGRMYEVFIEFCPNVVVDERPFDAVPDLREMRDVMFASAGRSGLIVRYKMIEQTEWFLAADPEWTETNLFSTLQENSRESSILWGAIARRHHFKRVLAVIGTQMIGRAVDTRLSRDVRSTLARSVILEALHSLNDRRPPVIPLASISQMIRSLEDEVRARVAGVLEKFTQAMSRSENRQDAPLAQELFVRAVRPFLENVWPQEVMLATPGVSKAFADLPIACGEAFVDAAAAIDHFLVHFESWSLHDYGIVGRGDSSNLELIDSPEKAAALLRLLDRTIGGADGVPVPYDLGDALEQIRRTSIALTELPSYRRLATLTRR